MAAGSTRWPRAVTAAQALVLLAERTPLRGLVHAFYFVLARVSGWYLTRGESRPTVYLRAGLASGEFVPGRSDIDLAIVLASDGDSQGVSSARVWRRWERIDRVFPKTGRLLEQPRVYDELELRDVAASSAMTYGLVDRGEDRAGLLDGGGTIGRRRILLRPGLYSATFDWRLLSGPDRRPPEPPRSAQERRIAAWLELNYWWRWAFRACADLDAPSTPSLCVKLVAESARVWLWLAKGERFGTRVEVLEHALQQLPEEEQAIRGVLAPRRSPRHGGAPWLRDVLSALVRLSTRSARLIADETAAAGATEVRLFGNPLDEPGGGIALCDWRALAMPPVPIESFELIEGDPADPGALGAATRSQRGAVYGALGSDGLLVFPAAFGERSRARAIKCEVTDPALFALARGSAIARFPNVRGWSAEDTARRAVAEHRAWLRRSRGAGPLWMLLSAARAALFLESVRRDEPVLAPTLRGAAELLAARFPESAVEEAVRSDAVEAVRTLVLRLPDYSR